MLKDPPCIYPLIGCSRTATIGSSTSNFANVASSSVSSSSRSSFLNFSSSSSSSRSSFFASSSSSSNSPSSLFTSSATSSAFSSSSISALAHQYASGSTFAGIPQYIVGQDVSSEKGKGKGYKPYPKPRTGADSDYYSRANTASLLSPALPQNSSEGPVTLVGTFIIPILILGIALCAALYGIRKRKVFFQ